MKDSTTFKYISIGILLGILFSGVFVLSWNSIKNRSSSTISSTQPIIETTSQIGENLPLYSSIDEGKININQATVAELVDLPGIGEAKAFAIIEFREKYGFFKNITELSYVPGIGSELLESIEELITTGND